MPAKPGSGVIESDNWDGFVAQVSQRNPPPKEVVLFLHPPKTGGTSVAGRFGRAQGWECIRLPRRTGNPDMCHCGAQDCDAHSKRIGSGSSLFVSFGHVPYSQVRGLRDRLVQRGVSNCKILMTYRPIDDRLRSMFRDYWTQVSEAERFLEVGDGLSPHRQRVVSRYLKDSKNYRSTNGAMSGRLWFLAFAKFGPGVPFYLRDLFSSPAELKKALDSDSIAVLPTEDIDAFTERFLGVEPSNRGRVSKPGNSGAVEKAFRQARSIVRLLSRRDRKYADIMTRHLARTEGTFLGHSEFIFGIGK